MTPAERDLATIFLDGLNKIEGQPTDPQAETLIRETTAVRTDAPYSLLQTVLIQDLSLHNAQSRITDLEAQLTEAKCASSAPPSFLGAPSVLGAVFSGEPSGGAPTGNMPPRGPGTGPAPLATTAQAGYVPEGSAAPPAPSAGLIGGGFLRSAAVTAASTAGGALLFEGIRSIFGHHDTVNITDHQPAALGLGETVLNNHYGAETGASGVGSTDEHAGAGDGLASI
jgi:hypothetical protein